MFRNTLFLKIILIFTLPALGILYFSSVLVYEKIQSFNEVDRINNNLTYLKNTEKLISSLQEERELTVLQLLKKDEKPFLDKSRSLSIKNYEELERNLKSLNFDNRFSQLTSEINKIVQFRKRVDKSDATIDEVFEQYNQFNKILLEGDYTSEQLVEALKYDVQSKKDNSISTGTNNLTFMQNSLTYLNKKTFEPFIEIIKEGKEIKNNDYYAGSTDI